jgi:hypothetical protein
MQQADFSLPHFSPIELLLPDYEVAVAEKTKTYDFRETLFATVGDALVGATFDAVEAICEAACEAAYEAAEAVADMILGLPARSPSDFAIKARVLLARGPDPANMCDYRPGDLSRFVQEIAARV